MRWLTRSWKLSSPSQISAHATTSATTPAASAAAVTQGRAVRAPAHREPTASHWHQRCIVAAARMSTASAGFTASQGALWPTVLLALLVVTPLVIRMGMGMGLMFARVQNKLCPDM